MPVTLATRRARASRPVHFVARGELDAAGLDERSRRWAAANGFTGQEGRVLIVPDEDGSAAAALFGASRSRDGFDPLSAGRLSRSLPEGDWHVSGDLDDPDLVALGLVLGGYAFTRYGKQATHRLSVHVPDAAHATVATQADAVALTRDLINTPANDMGPEQLEKAARALARKHRARISVIRGEALLKRNFPLIHAVGRAADRPPRLIDMSWGPRSAPKVTLVGKGVCFDTGGLDIKPSRGMLLMKKDMGGAANVLGLASMVMAAGLKIRLRVLIPAVENAIAGNAFRPGDVLPSRKGMTVEIGNTDAEGRLILADALALADEEAPELLVDMATLTGAARVALGADIAPFYTDDDALADQLLKAGGARADPLWRMPLWNGYNRKLDSKVADVGNVTTDGFAGSITAALFLRRFVERSRAWTHFDIYGWCPNDRPHCPVGGEAQGIRALFHLLQSRYGG